MVQLLSLIIINQTSKNGIIVYQSFELSHFGFFQRNSVKETCIFSSREVSSRTPPGTPQSVEHSGYFCYIYRLQNGLSVCCITDKDYPSYAAMNFLVKAITVFQEKIPKETWMNINRDTKLQIPELSSLLIAYQDPTKVEKIEAIKKELDETIHVTIKTMDQMLDRGEKMEDLIDRTNDLSDATKEFMVETKKMNSCCVIF